MYNFGDETFNVLQGLVAVLRNLAPPPSGLWVAVMPPAKRKSGGSHGTPDSKAQKVAGKPDPAKLHAMPHIAKLSEWLLSAI